MAAMQKKVELRPQDMPSFIKSIQAPSHKPKHTLIRRLSRRGSLIPAIAGISFSGLVAFFISQGYPRFRAEKLAEEKIADVASTNTGTSSKKNDYRAFKQAKALFSSYDYDKCIEFCNAKLEQTPSFYELYVIRGLSLNAKVSQNHALEAPSIVELLTRAKEDFENALKILPTEEPLDSEFSPIEIIKLKDKISKIIVEKLTDEMNDVKDFERVRIAAEIIDEYPDTQKIWEVYGMRATGYFQIGKILQQKNLDATDAWKHCQLDAEKALEMFPLNYKDERKALEQIRDRAISSQKTGKNKNRVRRFNARMSKYYRYY